jgi:hypothetical protein
MRSTRLDGYDNALHSRSFCLIQGWNEFVTLTVEIAKRKAVRCDIVDKGLRRSSTRCPLQDVPCAIIRVRDQFIGIIGAAVRRSSGSVPPEVILQGYSLRFSNGEPFKTITRSSSHRSRASEMQLSHQEVDRQATSFPNIETSLFRFQYLQVKKIKPVQSSTKDSGEPKRHHDFDEGQTGLRMPVAACRLRTSRSTRIAASPSLLTLS